MSGVVTFGADKLETSMLEADTLELPEGMMRP